MHVTSRQSRYCLQVTTVPSTAMTVSANGGAYFGDGAFDYVAISLMDGSRLWRATTGAYSLAQPGIGATTLLLLRPSLKLSKAVCCHAVAHTT